MNYKTVNCEDFFLGHTAHTAHTNYVKRKKRAVLTHRSRDGRMVLWLDAMHDSIKCLWLEIVTRSVTQKVYARDTKQNRWTAIIIIMYLMIWLIV